MTVSVRRAAESDAPSLSRICLLTGDAGASAEHLHTYGEFPGLIYAEPYVKLPTTFGFVMMDDGEVVGYILGSVDTRAFEHEAEALWWPPLRAKYPASGLAGLREADERYVKLFHHPQKAAPCCMDFSPAHLHINILPRYQQQGWGRRLIGHAIEYLKEQGIEGVWLGLDPRNEGAKKFYEKLSFKAIDITAGTMGFKWSNKQVAESSIS